jgi:YD repeat-containing protein
VSINFSGTDVGNAVAVDGQGRIVVVGTNAGGTDLAIARLNGADGTLDTTFDGDGKQTVNVSANPESAADVLIQPDGMIVVGGSGGDFEAVRLGGGGTRLYAIQDASGNVTAVTDATGVAVERYVYDPFGQLTVLNGDYTTDTDGVQDVDQPYLWRGARIDTAAGNYHLQSGDYSPRLGRSLQPLPTGHLYGPLAQGNPFAPPAPGAKPKPARGPSRSAPENRPEGGKYKITIRHGNPIGTPIEVPNDNKKPGSITIYDDSTYDSEYTDENGDKNEKNQIKQKKGISWIYQSGIGIENYKGCYYTQRFWIEARDPDNAPFAVGQQVNTTAGPVTISTPANKAWKDDLTRRGTEFGAPGIASDGTTAPPTRIRDDSGLHAFDAPDVVGRTGEKKGTYTMVFHFETVLHCKNRVTPFNWSATRTFDNTKPINELGLGEHASSDVVYRRE